VHQARSIPSGGHAARLRGGPRAPAAPPRGGAALAVPLPSRPPDNTSSGAPGQRSAAERVPRAAHPSGQSAHGLRLGASARPRGRAPTGNVMQGYARAPRRMGACQRVHERCRHSGRPLKGTPRAAAPVIPHPPRATQDGASRPALQFRTSWSCGRRARRARRRGPRPPDASRLYQWGTTTGLAASVGSTPASPHRFAPLVHAGPAPW
jgi:hypothetical protein